MANKKNFAEQSEKPLTFTKAQLMTAERFSGRRDALNALLSEDKEYTAEAAEELIEKFMKGTVK